MIPAGVQGTSVGRPIASLPTLIRMKTIDVLTWSTASIIRASSICAGKGNCTKMPSMSSRPLSELTSSSSSVLVVLAAKAWYSERMPTSRRRESCCARKRLTPDRQPTRTAARQGTMSCFRPISPTSRETSRLMSSAGHAPSSSLAPPSFCLLLLSRFIHPLYQDAQLQNR